MQAQSEIGFGGALSAHKVGARKAPLSWRVRNALRWSFIVGLIVNTIARVFSKITGIVTITTDLAIRAKIGGEWIDYGVVSRRVVTDAGVAFFVDDWDNSGTDISTLNFHGCGTGATAEAAGDTALVTESTTALNPDSTRATGTRSQPAANQYRSVGTATFDGSAAITEHGIFSQSATGGGTLWDRSVFSAINVASGDSIQFTYTATLTSGG
jgi:hypothetical protein